MAEFEVRVERIFIKPHPNADRLEIGNIGSPDGWQVVVMKGRYKTGDLVAYIGENSVVPEATLKKYGFWNEEKNVGMLAGSNGDRVKGVRLRGEFSLGICIPLTSTNSEDGGVSLEHVDDGYPRTVYEGENVDYILGVTKYQPPIPVHMAGEVYNGGTDIGVSYDIEDLRKWPDVFVNGEEIQVTTKLHGTFCQVICMNPVKFDAGEHKLVTTDKMMGLIAVGSKGMGAAGLFFKHNEANAGNLYLNTTKEFWSAIVDESRWFSDVGIITVCGEVFGDGVQDLNYGLKNQRAFRVFDVYVGSRGAGRYLDDDELDAFCIATGIERVPVLYRGPYDKQLMIALANDPETSLPNVQHMREGVVIKPVEERRDGLLGRVVVKTRSEAYMARKGGSELN